MLIRSSLRQRRSSADLAKEAQVCRKYAAELANRPEERFLMRIADVFDELAREQKSRAR